MTITTEDLVTLRDNITPGPWCNEARSEWWDSESEEEIGVIAGTDPDANPSKPIAEAVCRNAYADIDREQIANAEAISCVPDMINELLRYRDRYGELADERLS